MFTMNMHDFKIGDTVTLNNRGLGAYLDTFPKDKKIYGVAVVIDHEDMGVKFPEGTIKGHKLSGAISSTSGWWLSREHLEGASPEEIKKEEKRS